MEACRKPEIRDVDAVKSLLGACQAASHVDPGVEKLVVTAQELVTERVAKQDLEELSRLIDEIAGSAGDETHNPEHIKAFQSAWDKCKALVFKNNDWQERMVGLLPALESTFAKQLLAETDVVETQPSWNLMPVIVEIAKERIHFNPQGNVGSLSSGLARSDQRTCFLLSVLKGCCWQWFKTGPAQTCSQACPLPCCENKQQNRLVVGNRLVPSVFLICEVLFLVGILESVSQRTTLAGELFSSLQRAHTL